MSVIQNEVSIRSVPNKYDSQSRQIKDLVTQFESAQQDRISDKQKNLVENSNQNHIFLWSSAHIPCFLDHKSYTEWELQSACITRILLKYTYPVIFREYGVPKSSLTRDLRKIYPPLQINNINDQKNRFEIRGISWYKVGEIVKCTVQMNKSGQRTYLNEYEDSLVVASANIEGGRGLPLEWRGIEQQLQNVVKSINSQFGDYNIKEKSSMRYCLEVIKRVNKKEDENEDPKKIVQG